MYQSLFSVVLIAHEVHCYIAAVRPSWASASCLKCLRVKEPSNSDADYHAGSLRAEVQMAAFDKTFISQHNRALLLQVLRDRMLELVADPRSRGMSQLVSHASS